MGKDQSKCKQPIDLSDPAATGELSEAELQNVAGGGLVATLTTTQKVSPLAARGITYIDPGDVANDGLLKR